MTLVALEGKVHRKLRVRMRYGFDAESEYDSMLTVTPRTGEVADAPEFGWLKVGQDGSQGVPQTVPDHGRRSPAASPCPIGDELKARAARIHCGVHSERQTRSQRRSRTLRGQWTPGCKLAPQDIGLSGKRAEPATSADAISPGPKSSIPNSPPASCRASVTASMNRYDRRCPERPDTSRNSWSAMRPASH